MPEHFVTVDFQNVRSFYFTSNGFLAFMKSIIRLVIDRITFLIKYEQTNTVKILQSYFPSAENSTGWHNAHMYSESVSSTVYTTALQLACGLKILILKTDIVLDLKVSDCI